MKEHKVVWSPKAVDALYTIYQQIQEDAPDAAKKVAQALVELGESLNRMPRRFPIEPLLAEEDIEYRFTYKWSYKLIYTINEDRKEVLIVQVFNTRQSPEGLQV